jgi:hypothetical protein
MKAANCTAWGLLCAVVYVLMMGASAVAQQPVITVVDVPGAINTESIAISPAGEIAGFYAGANNVMQAYVRDKHGKITTFSAPNAATTASVDPFSLPCPCMAPGTFAVGIDSSGAVTGYYYDANNVAHGYLRTPSGTFTIIDAPGAGAGPGQGTFAGQLNLSGAIAGSYVDGNNASHGFVRDKKGFIIGFDAPGAGTGPGQGTWVAWAQGISTTGAITGYFADSGSVYHGFVRDADGSTTTFDGVPVTGLGPGQGTYTWAINPSGTAAGTVLDSNNLWHGVLRTADGKITEFDVPGAGAAPGQGTQAEAIDPAGVIVGTYADANNTNHGFIRAADGTITKFDVAGAGSGPGQGTLPMTNNTGDTIIGYFIDGSNGRHGFVRK